MSELSHAEMDQVLEFFRELIEDYNEGEAVAKILVFHPEPDRVRQIERRAHERSSAADRINDLFEARRWLEVADALAELAVKAEQLPPLEWSRLPTEG